MARLRRHLLVRNDPDVLNSRMARSKSRKRNRAKKPWLKACGQLGVETLADLERCPRYFQELYGRMYEAHRVGKKLDPKRVTAAPLPVLESGTVSKNAAIAGQLDALRVTSLGVLDACPRQWQAKYVQGIGVGTSSKAGNLGTLAHEVIEAFLLGNLFLEDQARLLAIQAKLDQAGMPFHEIQALWAYLWQLKDDLPYVQAVELEFTLRVIEGALPLRGHIDLVLKRGDDLIIVDHKTNRKAQPVTWWEQQLQPQAYAWAIRQMWPGHRLYFRIGYVNLGRSLTWQMRRETDFKFVQRFTALWEQFAEYRQKPEPWPARHNENCKYCPISGRCPTFIHQGQAFIDSLKLT
jgi:hypothetical protein